LESASWALNRRNSICQGKGLIERSATGVDTVFSTPPVYRVIAGKRPNALADGSYEQVPFMRVLQILEHHGAIQRAYERAHTFTEKARSVIATFPDSPAQRALSAVVDLVTERNS
jgi:geranylgeranyl pyrophosphate synthase